MKKFTRPSKKQTAQAMLDFAPDDCTLPDWVEKDANRKTPIKKQKIETPYLKSILKACADLYRYGIYKIWVRRNNNGLFLTLDGKNKVLAGLGKGTSDAIGYTSKIITQEMVGKPVAVFTAIETKGTGKADPDQERFIAQVNTDGGYGLILSVKDERYEGAIENAMTKIVTHAKSRLR